MMTEETKDKDLIDSCYELVYDFSHDQHNITEANTVGAAAAAGLAIDTGLAAAAPLVVVVEGGATTAGGAAGAALAVPATSVTAGGLLGVSGSDVLIPLEANALFLDCVPLSTLYNEAANTVTNTATQMYNEVTSEITGFFSGPNNSIAPVPETPSTPVNDGFLVMDTPNPDALDVPTITASETSAPAASFHTEPENEFSLVPSIFDSTPSVTDSTPVWGADSSSNSYEVIDPSPSYDNGGNAAGGPGSGDN
jgi:hypothetical protein